MAVRGEWLAYGTFVLFSIIQLSPGRIRAGTDWLSSLETSECGRGAKLEMFLVWAEGVGAEFDVGDKEQDSGGCQTSPPCQITSWTAPHLLGASHIPCFPCGGSCRALWFEVRNPDSFLLNHGFFFFFLILVCSWVDILITSWIFWAYYLNFSLFFFFFETQSVYHFPAHDMAWVFFKTPLVELGHIPTSALSWKHPWYLLIHLWFL